MSTILSQLLLALLFIIVGFIAGALVTLLWNERESAQKRQGSKMAVPNRWLEAGLWRDQNSGRMLVELDEETFLKREQLSARQRQQLTHLLEEWGDWLGLDLGLRVEEPIYPGQSTTTSAPKLRETPLYEPPSAGTIAPETEDQLASRLLTVARVAPPTNSASLQKPADSTSGTAYSGATMPVSASKGMDSATPGSMVTPVEAKPKPTSIVGQIDEILQEMLANSAEKRAIRLVEHPSHGVTVWIGVQRYEGIDAVQDKEAQNLIRAAVAEWERRAEEERWK